jgi:hypothetical protein
MLDAYCVTALEAAEMAGIELDQMMRIARKFPGVAINVDGAWRVDPKALAMLSDGAKLADAA